MQPLIALSKFLILDVMRLFFRYSWLRARMKEIWDQVVLELMTPKDFWIGAIEDTQQAIMAYGRAVSEAKKRRIRELEK